METSVPLINVIVNNALLHSNSRIKQMPPQIIHILHFFVVVSLPQIFRLDALAKALSVIATATWLAGWLAGWVSVTASIVSRRLNLSENFLDHLVGRSFKHLGPITPIPNSMGNPFIGGVKYMGVGKLGIFVRFSMYIAVYLGNGAR